MSARSRKLRLCVSVIGISLALLLSLASGGVDDGESSSSSSCQHTYDCINGNCECTTSGREGQSCCDPDDCGTDDSGNCESVCEVCE